MKISGDCDYSSQNSVARVSDFHTLSNSLLNRDNPASLYD